MEFKPDVFFWNGKARSMNAQPLRIAYLISKYPAVSHTFILREVLALRERGAHIEVASINNGPAYEKLTEVERNESASTFYVKKQSGAGALKAFFWLLVRHPTGLFASLRTALSLGAFDPARSLLCLFYLLEAAIVARWMQERQLTHLHVHFASQAATVALLASYVIPLTLSMTVHGPDEFYDVPGSFLSAKVARSRFVVCISFFAQSQLMKVSSGKDWSKFEIARLGVDTAHFAPSADKGSSRVCEILCVGRLVETKGQQVLIEAVERLAREGRAIHLTLVGDGPSRRHLEEVVRQRSLASIVDFTGSMNQDQIRSFYAATDIFALASFAEGIPVVLMEAMAMELPCVATRINGIPELIRDGVDGLLVAPSDVVGLAAAIASLMDDPGLRQRLGAAGRNRIQQAYELGQSADRLSAILCGRLNPGSEQTAHD